ncbi:MAG TPA: magnesium/cobalt transporter CorA [Actinomycetota bacterium]|nr:magnesium/cobalt transporter CorA [Actinomycetota bacterium]
MITCRVYRAGSLEEEAVFDRDIVGAARAEKDHVWLDVIDPSDEELRALQDEFSLHELAVEDSRKWGQRAKVDFYPEHLFLVAHGLTLDPSDEVVDREVHLFAGGAFYVITIRREPRFEFGDVATRLAGGPGLGGEGIGHLLYLVLDEIVDGYLDVIERFEDLSDDIEDALSEEDDSTDEEPSRILARRMFHARQQVVRFRRLAAPMRETVDLLLETPEIATPPLVPYYRDVLDHVIRALELADNVRDVLTSARELQLAQQANRMNVVVKQLSAWAAIILIPTLIAGIYGMNFRHMPELDWLFGYPFALAVMGLTGFVLFRMFRKRDWL